MPRNAKEYHHGNASRVPIFDSAGVAGYGTDVRYVCQARPFTISDAPERIVVFDPNRSILYAGSLIQGKSRKELGSRLALTIAQRRPIRVSIPDLPTDIRAAMQASYSSFTGSASGGIGSKHQAVLETSRIAITAVGGDGDAVAAMIETGDWCQYFASSAELSQALPLSYTFTDLADGTATTTSSSTGWTICSGTATRKPPTGRTPRCRPETGPSISRPASWISRAPAAGRGWTFSWVTFWIADAREDIPHRALGNASGVFTKLPWQRVPDDADDAGPYEVRIGDVDADSDYDVASSKPDPRPFASRSKRR